MIPSSLSDLFSEKHLVLDLRGATAGEAVLEIVQRLHESGDLDEPAKFYELVMEREQKSHFRGAHGFGAPHFRHRCAAADGKRLSDLRGGAGAFAEKRGTARRLIGSGVTSGFFRRAATRSLGDVRLTTAQFLRRLGGEVNRTRLVRHAGPLAIIPAMQPMRRAAAPIE